MAYVEIPLSKGFVTIVDVKDYPLISHMNWHVNVKYKCPKIQYAASNIPAEKSLTGKRTTVRLHRFLLKPPAHMQVDHINGNGLDNRRCNLRLCTNSENKRNQIKKPGLIYKYKGISLINGKWAAAIKIHGEQIYLGRFLSEKEAALAYNEAAKKYHGEFARLNII